MTSVGETLRAERLRKNFSLEQIASETKITSRLLDAIEKNQFDVLPRGVFAKSFVRQYARFLGLNEEELAAEAQRAMHPEVGLPSFAIVPAEPAFKVPKVPQWKGSGSRPSSSPLPSLAMLVVVMLVCSGIYALWQRTRHPAFTPVARPEVKTLTAAPAPLKAAVPAPVTPVVEHTQESLRQADAARSAAPPAGSVNPEATLHASLTADEPTWVRAWADGKEVMTVILQPNVTKTVEAVSEIRLRTGNAGALQITLNGKPVGPAGPKGQVRIVTLTSDGVQILVPPKPVPVPDSR